ncbi:MAG: bifunctional diguanylate cyclase/phosphodiesterase [Phenylobacterium sp.]|uniref:putative bifunctional diguanylate cyclase/phosphodiesterase n=1 Tax=Phenylobacterium sp. TaxID=1871053 RepID=UPI002736EB6E|nr:bifunctional diguanylate cyclase/phosphodiesterase [Phenylobacterium sp.]MDP1642984.1 bifunctional diguanylate cyclase/phosphodiesterase [Phenylobacterium sp.]MDP3115479.1 bifunctional diguanylate cyclase/phosphodiesterase [Phenylobacterium sp.]MDZ4054744.1 bifunctional diguanylate cyclase/phosphodiesterase [Phenylobacterium sp.]
MASDRWIWDATSTLEALGAADVVLWHWEPERDRLRLTGASRALGLGPLAPECSSAAIRALALPQDRARAEEVLRVQEPGAEIAVRLRMRGGGVCIWRGVWLEEGVRAAGVVAAETKFAASDLDSLTGLLDRKSFILRAREHLQIPGDYELVVGDLDRLRRLNEALGHERADLVLAALGSRLAAAFPPGALLSRVGEDEFGVLARVGDVPASEVLRLALERPLRVAGFDIHPTLSVGAVRARGGDEAPEAAELLRRAELAVEAAKTGGRGGAAAYGRALESDGLSRLAMEGDLRGAIGRGELTAFYQPIVRLSTGALSGFEALVRWRHPRRGLLMPDQFLPLCEEMGLMSALGSLMMREAASQLAVWRRNHRAAGELTVAVNLSTGEIDHPDLISNVVRILRETGLPPGALKLEVTEGDVMRDPDRAAIILRDLRQAGAALALDDFGTGFSSLSYLTRLPFDTLKIDRYFVRTMGTDEGSAKIVSSVVKLGQDLDLEVVAEGVENAGMARQLLALGCDYGQGFGYAPALSAQEAEVYLNESYVDGAAPVKARG